MTGVVLALTAATGAPLSYLLCRWVVLPALSRAGVFDHPSARSSHDAPVIRGGGVGVLIGWIASFGVGIAGYSLLSSEGERASSVGMVIACWTAVLVFAVVGLLDDLHSLPALVRLVVQCAVGAGFAAVVVSGTSVGWAAALAIAVTAVLIVNGVNFMDGLNTLISAWAIVAGAWFAIASLVVGAIDIALMSVALAASAAGFIPLNRTPARAFLGDSGSYAIGSGATVLLWAYWATGGPIVVAFAPLIIPLLDVVTTLVRRLHRRENIFEAHRSHIYQRIQQIGLTHEQSSAVHTAMSAACCAAALPALAGAGGAAGAGIAFVGWSAAGTIYLALPALLGRGEGRTR